MKQPGLHAVLALAATVCVGLTPSLAQEKPFDLLIRGGHVIDARNGIDAVMDVGIAGAKIAEVSRGIDPARAKRVADATGQYVVPGLIDLHAHVFYGTESDAYLSNGDIAVQPDAHAIWQDLPKAP